MGGLQQLLPLWDVCGASGACTRLAPGLELSRREREFEERGLLVIAFASDLGCDN